MCDNNKRHKWADVLIALANGKTIQFKSIASDGWIDFIEKMYNSPLEAHFTVQWRIKPEPKPDFVQYGNILLVESSGRRFAGMANFDSIKSATDAFGIHKIQRQYKVVWDGETGEPKSIEFVR